MQKSRRTVKLAFYKGRRDLADRVISWWTRGPYSHVELVVCDPVTGLETSYSSSLPDGGVRKKSIDYKPERWDFVELPLHDGDVVAVWFEERMGAKYDILGIFGFILRPVAENKRKYFCSEAVGAALGFPNPWRLDPNTLYDVATYLSAAS